MRCQLISLLLVSAGLWCGCSEATSRNPKPEAIRENPGPGLSAPATLVRWHFIGSERLAADTNGARWEQMMNLPEALELREQALGKLARAPFQLLQNRLVVTNNDAAALFRPLFKDLLRAESCAELRLGTNQTLEFALAVRLETAAAGVWDTNLATILTAWTGMQPSPINATGQSGWELKKHDAPKLFQFTKAGDWVVLSCGDGELSLQTEMLTGISQHGRPWQDTNGSWLELTVDWPRLETLLPVDLLAGLPPTHLTLIGGGESLRTKVDFTCPEPVQQTFEPWQIPTNTIHEPLISFTACRGISSWLKRIEAIQRLKFEPLPDQIYGWGIGDVPFQSFLAAPSPNPTNTLKRLTAELQTRFNGALRQHGRGAISWSTNKSQLRWTGLPFVLPYVEPASEPSGPFLLAGVFPNNPRGKPPPAELLKEVVGHSSLVYYDWEVTQPRITQCRSLWQLYQIVFDEHLLKTNATAMRWLSAISPKLGNSVTEVSVTGPKQLTLVRKSGIGLTAIELMALSHWLESPKFPLGDYRLPGRTSATGTVPATNSANAETRR